MEAVRGGHEECARVMAQVGGQGLGWYGTTRCLEEWRYGMDQVMGVRGISLGNQRQRKALEDAAR